MDAIELDLLAEAFNLGLGKGSAALSELLGEEVQVTVPSLQILPKRPAIDQCAKRFDTEAHTVRQAFVDTKNASTFSGDAFLFIPQASSKILSRLLSGSEVSEAEILAELGNLILHSCLSSLADMIETELDSCLPEVHLNRTSDILIEIARNKNRCTGATGVEGATQKENQRRPLPLQDRVLQMGVQFKTLSREISGEVMLFLDLSQLPNLTVRVRDAVHRLVFG
ncbi:MAG: hypothetical protein HQL84_15640 [Magnetococcales bacterium]|nr:hypothetical protein [Magnetococcales bacterium]MBF0151453.1 hypothetical protein [Magnetococcales bacterium]MBF0174412.1 hypothetical protein [Magnetococcales bacterium]MBF0348431.1 hypothetical protein [Magnetococcales bacterium]MBF0632467.1 hypothetical protein [Magnetococcales bacterium]